MIRLLLFTITLLIVACEGDPDAVLRREQAMKRARGISVDTSQSVQAPINPAIQSLKSANAANTNVNNVNSSLSKWIYIDKNTDRQYNFGVSIPGRQGVETQHSYAQFILDVMKDDLLVKHPEMAIFLEDSDRFKQVFDMNSINDKMAKELLFIITSNATYIGTNYEIDGEGLRKYLNGDETADLIKKKTKK